MINIEPRYIIGRKYEVIGEHEIRERCFPFNVILYVKRGSYFVYVDDTWHKFTEGESFWVKPYVRHHVKVTEESCLCWAHITYQHNNFFDFLTLCQIPFRYTEDKAETIGGICSGLADLSADKTQASQIKIQSLSLDLLYQVLKDSSDQPAGDYDHMLPAIDYINRNIGNSIDVTRVAQTMNMSVSSFRRSFTKTFGKSPQFFIIQRKLEVACEKLQYSDLTVGEIAYLLGYSDPLYFSRLFRKKLGVSPGKYRTIARSSV